jgi:hypothetical protein
MRLSPLLILTCPYIVRLLHFFRFRRFFFDLDVARSGWLAGMTQAVTQMTQNDATQNGLRHAENPGKYWLFCDSMTQ